MQRLMLLGVAVVLGRSLVALAEDRTYVQHVAPILARHCAECHGAELSEAKLNLEARDRVLYGSASGRILVPGSASQSLIWKLIQPQARPHMPPTGQLSPEELGIVRDWINGLTEADLPSRSAAGTADHWAYRPLSTPVPPDVKNASWTRQPLDRFVLHRIEESGIAPATEASAAVLCRRLYLDLIGLPPTPEELNEFEASTVTDPTAIESLVDRLLASPLYGERWGRHWLDLARYADSGGFHEDIDRPFAWRYRDYVVRSLNEDKPYAQFVREQIAGDEFAPQDPEAWIATGFCRNGPTNDDNMGEGLAREKYRLDLLDDVISTSSVVFQGQTIGCARCHDHKFDPLSQANYYELLSIFDNTERVTMIVDDTGSVIRQPAAKKGEPKPATMPVTIMALTNSTGAPRVTHLLWRGDVANPGPAVSPGVPRALAFEPLSSASSTGAGRRRDWANWLVSPRNSLTWRVIANRLWQHHFHRGIVATPSNFGQTGAAPTHPDLLDWLAGEMIRHNGHWKPLHRAMVLSSTYRLSTTQSYGGGDDYDNRLFSRRSLHRMQAEVLRDSILAVSGSLNLQMGGPGVKPRVRPELLSASQRNKWPVVAEDRAEHWRRSVYVYVKRQLPLPFLALFDVPDSAQTCERRDESVVPTQALVLMNDEFTQQQSLRFASRLRLDSDESSAVQVERAIRVALGRGATPTELAEGQEFLATQHELHRAAGAATASLHALADLCHVLFNSNEFAFFP